MSLVVWKLVVWKLVVWAYGGVWKQVVELSLVIGGCVPVLALVPLMVSVEGAGVLEGSVHSRGLVFWRGLVRVMLHSGHSGL